MDETRKKAFDFASDVSKQLITLAAGLIAVLITFSKEMIGGDHISQNALTLMCVSCGLYLLSIICGIWHLFALTGELETTSSTHRPTTRGKNATIPSIFQIAFFLIAIVATIVYATVAVRTK